MSTSLVVDTSKPINGIYLVKTRECKMCKLWKPLSNFGLVSKVKCKRHSKCKDCIKIVNKRYYDNYRRKKEVQEEAKEEDKTDYNEQAPEHEKNAE
jgi:hypothetical protein